MKNNITRTITLDCQDQIFGRTITDIAIKLMGKDKVEYLPNLDLHTTIYLKNYKQFIFTGKKMLFKKYYSHSGYIGNLKECNLKDLWIKNPKFVIQTAVLGMLPKNRLQSNRIKRLKFIED